ncbi:MAG: HAD family hydrolase [Planctomycetota bacterium]|nr:HAD family hydrolase [Planctomycetota bacterium]MCX8040220.1 HAD family hydrolase [Planctomycetota bacterium]MDW8372485.1 HAD family hydrolase [Planctomycetota bacterium]
MSEDLSGQFGSATVIPHDVALLILDCFETLIALRGRAYVPRRGVIEFLDHFTITRPETPRVVVSDAEQSTVEAALVQAGLIERLTAIIGAPTSLAVHSDGRQLKRLDAIVDQFRAPVHRTIFIGDSPLDAQAAHYHRIPFIRVPRSEDENFSFACLISGPSRYQSAEFSALFLQQYLRHRGQTDPPPPDRR